MTRIEQNFNRLCTKLKNRERILRMLARNETQIARLRASLRCRPAKPETQVGLQTKLPDDPRAYGLPAEADDGLKVPEFLDRNKKLQAMSDPRTKEKKAERKAVAREKLEAELTGKRRKMPLAGKAALDAIRDEA
jgi:hypothetical protein